MGAKTHLAIERGRQVGPACSPPWVDAEGRHTSKMTFVLDEVTCNGCKRSNVYKEQRGEAVRRAVQGGNVLGKSFGGC